MILRSVHRLQTALSVSKSILIQQCRGSQTEALSHLCRDVTDAITVAFIRHWPDTISEPSDD